MSLADKVALVTGASRGIGAATAITLATAGATVIITHRDSASGANETLSRLPGSGHRIIQVSAIDTAGLKIAAASVRSVEKRLDILVNNAAYTKVVPHREMDDLDDHTFDLVMRTNVRGPFATIREFRGLLEEGGGVVINISSIAGQMGLGSNVAYCASKAALNSMTLSLARALAPEIRVISVSPGLVETELTKAWPQRLRDKVLAQTPLQRLSTSEDVAVTVLACVTSMPMTTGIVITVDGGMHFGTLTMEKD